MPAFQNFYETLEECQQKLVGTIVTYDGQPAYIHSVGSHRDGIHRLNITILPNRIDRYEDGFPDDDEDGIRVGPVRKKINSPKFNRFRPFAMGYCNYFEDNDPHAKYLSRIPIRRSKQGLHHEAFHVSVPAAAGPRRGLDFLSVVQSEPFRDMVVGSFPQFEEVMDTLDNDSAIACDRDFAVRRDDLGLNFLFHKEDRVGVVRPNEILLGNKFLYLREKVISCSNLPNNVVPL